MQGEIAGKSCLELFSGSGILSFEALSRGAGQVVLVDQEAEVCRQQRNSFQQLNVSPDLFSIYCSSAEKYLEAPSSHPFDVIFMDPPFLMADYQPLVKTIIDNQWLQRDGLIYIESGIKLGQDKKFADLPIIKQKQAGQVHSTLMRNEH